MIPFPAAVDNTMVTAYRACPQKFWLAYMRGLAPVEESVHLVAGGAFAKGLEVARKEFWDQGKDFPTALALGGLALLAAYGNFDPHHEKTALNMLGALGYYFETWPIDGALVPYKAPGATEHDIECRIAIPIPGTKHPTTGDPVVYGGRFDARMVYKGSMLVGSDDKTSTQLGPTWVDRWRYNNQILGYGWGSWKLGFKLGAFMIRGISILKNGYSHSDPLQMLPEWKLERFEDNLRDTLADMVRDWERQRWPWNMGASCNAYGGCPFLTMCDSKDPEEWIATNYYQRSWDPLASRD